MARRGDKVGRVDLLFARAGKASESAGKGEAVTEVHLRKSIEDVRLLLEVRQIEHVLGIVELPIFFL